MPVADPVLKIAVEHAGGFLEAPTILLFVCLQYIVYTTFVYNPWTTYQQQELDA